MKEAQDLAFVILIYSGAFALLGMTIAEYARMAMVKSVLEAFVNRVEVKEVEPTSV